MFPPKGQPRAGTRPARSWKAHARCISRFHTPVTCSAGGSGNGHGGQTVAIAELIQNEAATPAVAHFTCVSATASLVATEVEALRAAGAETVLALRGDLAPGQEPADFRHAYELIPRLKAAGLRQRRLYPEGHIDCLDPRENIRHLRAKQDAGADFFITQLFFNNDDFYRFREAAESAGVAAPSRAASCRFWGNRRSSAWCSSVAAHCRRPSSSFWRSTRTIRRQTSRQAGIEQRPQPAGRSRSPRRQRPATHGMNCSPRSPAPPPKRSLLPDFR
ncbi:MAG: methylenetetrahydrofolate reductase [Adlercreutzia equolifaciens]